MRYNVKIIEDVLQKYKPAMRLDYDKYRNHVYRVYLNCLVIDGDRNNEEKYAIASVFHDIGIWASHTFDYLAPSMEQATIYLAENGKEEWIDEVTLMINWHHKINRYLGAHEEIVEDFRKADWIDFSLYLLTFGANKQKIKESRLELPNLGFHFFLIKETAKNILKHPLSPLPMFKK